MVQYSRQLGGDIPKQLKPIEVLEIAQDNGIEPADIFEELANRMGAKRLADAYRRKLQDKWRAGELGPKLFNSKVDAIDAVDDAYNRFVSSVLDENILRPFNSPPKKITTVRDWADAVETLYGFTNYFEQSLFSKPMSRTELEELEMFCNQYTNATGACIEPCAMVSRGFFAKEKRCSVKGQKVDLKKRPKELIQVKPLAFGKK